MDDIEMREAQLVLVSLQQRWDDERNRSFALIGELDAAERRLLALFSTEWAKRGGDRRTINRAYSEYRKMLTRQSADLAALLHNGVRCGVRHASQFWLVRLKVEALKALRSGYKFGFRNLHSL